MVLQSEEPGTPQGTAPDVWSQEVEGSSAAAMLVQQCHSCGNEFIEDALFCRRCGTKRAEANQLVQALDDDQKKAKDVVASFFEVSSQLEEADQRLTDEVEAHVQAKRKIKALETALVKKNAAHERDQQALATARTRLQEEIEAHRLTREAFDSSQDAIADLRTDIAALTQQLQQREANPSEAERYQALMVEFENQRDELQEFQEEFNRSAIDRERYLKLQDEFEGLSQKHDEVKSSFKSALFTVDAYRKEYHSVQGELEVSKRDLAKQREDLAKLLAESESLQEAKTWLEQMTRERARAALEKAQTSQDAAILRGFVFHWRTFVDQRHMDRLRKEQNMALVLRGDAAAAKRLQGHGFLEWARLTQRERHARRMEVRMKRALAAFTKQLLAEDHTLLQVVVSTWKDVVSASHAKRRDEGKRLATASRVVGMTGNRLKSACYRAWMQMILEKRHEGKRFATASRVVGMTGNRSKSACYRAWIQIILEKRQKEKRLATASRVVGMTGNRLQSACYRAWMQMIFEARHRKDVKKNRHQVLAALEKHLNVQESALVGAVYRSWLRCVEASSRLRRQKAQNLERSLHMVSAFEASALRHSLAAWAAQARVVKQKLRTKEQSIASTLRTIAESEKATLILSYSSWAHLTKARRRRRAGHSNQQALKSAIAMDSILQVQCLAAWSSLYEKAKRDKVFADLPEQTDINDSRLQEMHEKELQGLQAQLQALRQERDDAQGQLEEIRRRWDDAMSSGSDESENLRQAKAEISRLAMDSEASKLREGQLRADLERKYEEKLAVLEGDGRKYEANMNRLELELDHLRRQKDMAEERFEQTLQRMAGETENTKNGMTEHMQAQHSEMMLQVANNEQKCLEVISALKEREAVLEDTKKEIDSLGMELGETRAQRDDIMSQLQLTEQKHAEVIQSAQEREASLTRTNDDLRREIETLVADLEKAKQQFDANAIDAAAQKIEKLEADMRERDAQLDKNSQELTKVKTELALSSSQCDESKRELEEMKQDKKHHFEQTLQDIVDTVEGTNKSMSELMEQQHSEMKVQLAELKSERDDLISKLAIAENKCAESQAREDQLSKKNDSLRKEVEDLVAELDRSAQQPENGAVDATASHRRKCKELADAVQYRESQIEKNTADLARVNVELTESRRQCDEIRAQLNASERKCAEAEQALHAQEAKSESLREDVHSKCLELEGAKRNAAEIQRLTGELEDMRKQKDMAEERFEQTLHGMAETVEDMKKGMSELMDQQHSEMKQQVADAAQQCAEMTRALKEREAILEETKKEMNTLNVELQETKSQRDELMSQMTMAEKRCEDVVQTAQARESDLAKNNDALHKEVDSLAADLERAKQQRAENETDENAASHETRCKELADAIRQRELRLERNSEDLAKASAELSESRRQCDEIKSKLMAAEQRCAETEQALKSQETDFKRNTMALNSDSNTLATLRDDLHLKCRELEGAKKNQAEIQRLTAELDEMRREKDLADERFEQTLQGMSEDAEYAKKGMTEQMQLQYSEMKKQVTDAAQQCAEMTRALQEREAMLEETKKQIENLSAELQETRSQRDETIKHLAMAEKRCEEFVQTAQEREEDLAKDNASLRQEVEGLAADLEKAKLPQSEHETDEQIALQQQKCKELAEAIRDRELKLEKNNEELAKASEELMESKRQCDEIKSQLVTAEQRCAETELALHSQEASWKKNNLAMSSDSNTLASLRTDLHLKCLELDGAKRHQAEIQRLTSELGDVRRQKALADERFEETLQGMTKEAEHLKKGMAEQAQAHTTEMKKQVADAAQQCAEMTHALKEREAMLDDTRKDVARLNTELKETRSQRDGMVSQLAVAEKSCADMAGRAQEREATLAKSNDELQKEVQVLLADLSTARRHAANQSAGATGADLQKCKELQDAIQDREVHLERNSEELAKASEELIESRRQCELISTQLMAAEQRCTENEQALQSQELNLKRNHLLLTNDSNTLATLREDLHSKCLELDGSRKHQEEIQMLIAELQEAKREQYRMSAEAERLRKLDDERLEQILLGMMSEDGESLSEQIRLDNLEMKKQVVDAAQQCAEMSQALKERKSKLEESQQEIQKLKDELQETRSQHDGFMIQLSIAEATRAAFAQSLHECEARHEKNNEDLRGEVSSLAADLDKVKKKKHGNDTEDDSASKCKQLEEAIRSRESQLERNGDELAKASAESTDLSRECGEIKSKLASAEQTIAETERALHAREGSWKRDTLAVANDSNTLVALRADLRLKCLDLDGAHKNEDEIRRLVSELEEMRRQKDLADERFELTLQGILEKHADSPDASSELMKQQQSEMKKQVADSAQQCAEMMRSFNYRAGEVQATENLIKELSRELEEAQSHRDSLQPARGGDATEETETESLGRQPDDLKSQTLAADKKCSDIARALKSHEANLKRKMLAMTSDSNVLQKLQEDLRFGCLELGGIIKVREELKNVLADLEEVRLQRDVADERFQQLLLGMADGPIADESSSEVTRDAVSDMTSQVTEAAQQCAEVARACKEREGTIQKTKAEADHFNAVFEETKLQRDGIAKKLSDAEEISRTNSDFTNSEKQCEEMKRQLFAAEKKCNDAGQALHSREANLKKINLGLARDSVTLAALRDDLRTKCLALDGGNRKDAELARVNAELSEKRQTLDELRAEMLGIKDELLTKEEQFARTSAQEAEKAAKLEKDLEYMAFHRDELKVEVERQSQSLLNLDQIRADLEEMRHQRDEGKAQIAVLESAGKLLEADSAEFAKVRDTVKSLTAQLEEERRQHSSQARDLSKCQRELEVAKLELRSMPEATEVNSLREAENTLKQEISVQQYKFTEVVKALEATACHLKKQLNVEKNDDQDSDALTEHRAELKHQFSFIAKKCAESALDLVKQESAEQKSRQEAEQLVLELKVLKSGRDKISNDLVASETRSKNELKALRDKRDNLLSEKAELLTDLSSLTKQTDEAYWLSEKDGADESEHSRVEQADLTQSVRSVEARYHRVVEELEKIGEALVEAEAKEHEHADDCVELKSSLAACEEQCEKISEALDAKQSHRRHCSALTLDCMTKLTAFRNELMMKCVELSQPEIRAEQVIAELQDKLTQSMQLNEKTKNQFGDLQKTTQDRYRLAAKSRIMKVVPQLAFMQEGRLQEWFFVSWARLAQDSKLASVDEINGRLQSSLRQVKSLCAELEVLRKEHQDVGMRRREHEVRNEQMNRCLQNRETQVNEIAQQLALAQGKIRELVKSRNMENALKFVQEYTDYLLAQCFIAWACAKHPSNASAEWLSSWMNRRRRRFVRPDTQQGRFAQAPQSPRGPRALDNHVLRARSFYSKRSSSSLVGSTPLSTQPNNSSSSGSNLPALASARTPRQGLPYT